LHPAAEAAARLAMSVREASGMRRGHFKGS
jgi:hypothetical protein